MLLNYFWTCTIGGMPYTEIVKNKHLICRKPKEKNVVKIMINDSINVTFIY